MGRMLLRSTVVACAAGLMACTSTTMIRSNPPGARVFLDGEYVGTTPYTMSDTKIVGSTTLLRLEAPGYRPVNALLKRDEEVDIGACIAGVFLLVPFLWVMGYQAEHAYTLAPAAYGYPPPGDPGPPGSPPQPAPGHPHGYPPPPP